MQRRFVEKEVKVDLLAFDAKELYFEKEESPQVQALIQNASQLYGSGEAEMPLLKAYLRAPESLSVLVALNRFYYYQHRLEEALLVSEKALSVIAHELNFPTQWQEFNYIYIKAVPKKYLTQVRLYLFALKSIGFLNMRLSNFEVSQEIFEKILTVDEKDRIGARALLHVLTTREQ
jgi:tetratricopeptide (TPR) repeat protein